MEEEFKLNKWLKLFIYIYFLIILLIGYGFYLGSKQ
jgi:hypothetical protein